MILKRGFSGALFPLDKKVGHMKPIVRPSVPERARLLKRMLGLVLSSLSILQSYDAVRPTNTVFLIAIFLLLVLCVIAIGPITIGQTETLFSPSTLFSRLKPKEKK